MNKLKHQRTHLRAQHQRKLKHGVEFKFPNPHSRVNYVLFLWFYIKHTAWVLNKFAIEFDKFINTSNSCDNYFVMC